MQHGTEQALDALDNNCYACRGTAEGQAHICVLLLGLAANKQTGEPVMPQVE